MEGSSFRALPEPGGGWRVVVAPAAAIAGLCALATFTMIAFLVPQMDPECYSDGAATTICPLPGSRNPVLTGIFDARWPSLGGWEGLGIAVVVLSIMVAVGVSIFLSTTDPWSGTGGGPGTIGLQAGLTGTGLGFIAGGPGYVRPLVALVLVAAGLLAWLLAVLTHRIFVRSIRCRYAEHLRRTQLREHGRRSLADVVEVRWLQGAGTSDRLIFEVMARPHGDTRTVEGLLGTRRPDAPVVGGTVFVYSDGEGGHPTGIDVVMDPDPDSIRDLDAEQRYPDPSLY